MQHLLAASFFLTKTTFCPLMFSGENGTKIQVFLLWSVHKIYSALVKKQVSRDATSR